MDIFVTRIATGVLNVAIIYFVVDVFDMNSTVFELLSSVLIAIINYILVSWLFLGEGYLNRYY